MIGRILAVAIGLMTGLTGAQLPEFAQQYRQRLGGAIDALRMVVQGIDENARAEGLTREALIERFRRNSDPIVQRDAEDKQTIVDRLARLERQRTGYDEAGQFGRLLIFVRDADPGLARATYLDYEPAWPATGEGVAAGGAGFAAGWGLLLFLSRLGGRLNPWRRRRRTGQLREA